MFVECKNHAMSRSAHHALRLREQQLLIVFFGITNAPNNGVDYVKCDNFRRGLPNTFGLQQRNIACDSAQKDDGKSQQLFFGLGSVLNPEERVVCAYFLLFSKADAHFSDKQATVKDATEHFQFAAHSFSET